MADRLLQIKVDDFEADGSSVVGKVFNVYNTYANALAHGATGLATIYAVAPLTGAKGAAISQTAKTAGVTADNNGLVQFYAADGSYSELFLMSQTGRQGTPRRIVVA